jgi:hypothetical protein
VLRCRRRAVQAARAVGTGDGRQTITADDPVGSRVMKNLVEKLKQVDWMAFGIDHGE